MEDKKIDQIDDEDEEMPDIEIEDNYDDDFNLTEQVILYGFSLYIVITIVRFIIS